MALSEQEELELLLLLEAEEKAQIGTEATSPSFLGRLRETANIPAEKSREGLQQLAELVPEPEPTGSIAVDVLKGTPRIAAETVAEVAPEFITPEGLILGAAGKFAGPLLKTGAKAVKKSSKFLRRKLPSEAKLKKGIEQVEARQGGIKQDPVNFSSVADDLGVPKQVQTGVTKAGKPIFKQVKQDDLKREVLQKVLDVRRSGEVLPPQTARNIVKLFETELKKGKGFGGMIAKALGKGPSLQEGLLSKGKQFGERLVSKAAPGREALAKALGRVKTVKKGAKVAGGAIGLTLLQRILGNTLGSAVGSQIGG